MSIPKVKDPLVIEIENVVTNNLAMVTTFHHDTQEGENVEGDNAEPDGYPLFLLEPFLESEYSVNVANLQIRKVKKITCYLFNTLSSEDSNGTIAYTPEVVNATLNQMRGLATNLIYWLNQSPLSVGYGEKDPLGVNEFVISDMYSQMDQNLFGVKLVFDWLTSSYSTGYHDDPTARHLNQPE